MKTFLAYAAAVAGFALFGLTFFRPPVRVPEEPRLEVSASYVDFGTVASTATVRRVLSVRNAGRTPLALRRPVGSCGCTTGVLSTNLLRYGEEAALTVTFRAGGREGRQAKTVGLISNDPQHPATVVHVIANCVRGGAGAR